jgi:hypothetical protein
MAKTKEPKALSRGRASFNLIGRIRVTDKTFNLGTTYGSGWTDNQMYLGTDCGEGNVVFAEMRGGFFPDRDNTIMVFEKERDSEGKSTRTEIAWEDRFDESLLDTVTESAFITVGVEKDVKGKTVYKKFLTAYDAVEYLSEHLEEGTVVNIRGNLKYSEYEGNVTVKKEITSIALSRIENEEDFKATFTQTILLDDKSLGGKDADKNTWIIDAYVVDYIGNQKVDGKKIEVKKNVVFPKTFEHEIADNPEVTKKVLTKFFKVKKGKINELTVAGKLHEGGSLISISIDDLPDDIKEMIEIGAYTEEEATAKCATSGSRERRMIIAKPEILHVGQGEERKPIIQFEEAKYEDSDLIFYEQALIEAGGEAKKEEVPWNDDNKSIEDADFLAMLDDM